MKSLLHAIFGRFGGLTVQKRSQELLSADKWHEVLISAKTKHGVIGRVSNRQMSDWCRFMVELTAPGESVLEVASGTGEISLLLAALGRRVTLVDLSSDNLRFSEECAAALGLAITTVQADVLGGMPFPDDAFDCSWSSGLLEHFPAENRRTILRGQARITTGPIVSLVPNAASLAYRVGKADQEARGVWPYGVEMPLHSQQEDFAAVGLVVTEERTIGARHALSFLRRSHPLRRGLNRALRELGEAELLDCRQGYLLATVGRKVPEGAR